MDRLELLEYLPGDVFVGKVVSITGGGSGINLGIARAFASLGADLAICGRSAERLESAAAELEELGPDGPSYRDRSYRRSSIGMNAEKI